MEIGGDFIDCIYEFLDMFFDVFILYGLYILGGELVCIFVVFLFSYFYFPHMCLCVLFSVSGNIQVDSDMLLPTLATDR